MLAIKGPIFPLLWYNDEESYVEGGARGGIPLTKFENLQDHR